MSEREFRVTIKEGRKWATVRFEAMQDNSPRYNVRVFKLDRADPEWWRIGDYLDGFMFGPDGEDAGVALPQIQGWEYEWQAAQNQYQIVPNIRAWKKVGKSVFYCSVPADPRRISEPAYREQLRLRLDECLAKAGPPPETEP